MRSHRRTLWLAMAGFVAVGLTTALVASQMQGGGQMGQMGSGQMSGQGHQGHQGMSTQMTSADQMMRHVDAMMAKSAEMMRDFSASHQQMRGMQDDPLMRSMQGILDQMRQCQGAMNDLMKNQGLAHNNDAMKAFREAGQNLQQMGTAYQSLLKNMNQTLKGIPREPKE